VLIDSEKMKTFFGNIKLKIGSIEKKSNTQFKELNDYAYLIMKNMDDETKEWVFIMETKETPGP
jgi:hypothetical protein